jgi:two-component system, NarL family, sensor histidine kinase DesK
MDQYARRGRRWGLVFAVGYLVFLVVPAYTEATSRHPLVSLVLVLGALILFVAVYMWFWLHLAYERRLRPLGLVVLAVLCATAAGLSLHDMGWIWLLIYCGVAAGASTWDRRVAIGLLLGILAEGLALAALEHAVDASLLSLAVTVVMSGASMIGIGWLIESNAELRKAREEASRLAVAEERLRFARDLHDLLGHSLSLIVLKSELAGRLGEVSPERAVREIRDVERVARDALREVRDAVGGYRQLALGAELESARATLGAAGVEVSLEADPGALPSMVDSTLAWALREGVTNIVRHSGARRAAVRLGRANGSVELELLDDGAGCDGSGDGNGLRGLRERVAARDGRVLAGPRAQGGFRLAVSLPLRDTPRGASTAEPG